MNAKTLAAMAVATLASGSFLMGQSLLTNGNFEIQPGPSDPLVPSWDISATGNIHQAEEGATSGTFAAAFNIGADSEGTVLSQTFPTIVGTLYKVEFDAGVFGKPTGAPLQLQVAAIDSGAQTLADRIVYPPNAFTFDSSLVQFRHYQFTFTATTATTTLRFTDHGLGNGAADTLLDTVSVVATSAPPPNALGNPDFEVGPFDTTGTVTSWDVGGTIK